MPFPTLISSDFLPNEIALPISVDDALYDYTANWNWNANENDHVTNNICFTAGTQIVVGAVFTEDGTFTDYVTVNIEDIEVGDLVYSYDTITGEVSQQEVTDVFVREVDHLNYLTVVDAEGNEQIIETTDSHPFWVVTDEPDLERAARSVVDENGITLYHEGVAPTDNGYWVEAKDLQEGDVFLDANGELSTLVSTERVEFSESITVYNFTVEGDHNYFVLAEGGGQTSLLVHNAEYGVQPTDYWYKLFEPRPDPGYQGIISMANDIKAAKYAAQLALLQEIYDTLEKSMKEKGLSEEQKAALRADLDKFVKKARTTDNTRVIQGCTKWVDDVAISPTLPLGSEGVLEFDRRKWDYTFSAWTTGLVSDWVLGHEAIEVIVGGKSFYFDNGWWGPIFKSNKIPWWVQPQQHPN